MTLVLELVPDKCPNSEICSQGERRQSPHRGVKILHHARKSYRRFVPRRNKPLLGLPYPSSSEFLRLGLALTPPFGSIDSAVIEAALMAGRQLIEFFGARTRAQGLADSQGETVL